MEQISADLGGISSGSARVMLPKYFRAVELGGQIGLLDRRKRMNTAVSMKARINVSK
jgi:hypothetical protein